MDTFFERVDLHCLYFDLRQILGPQERFNLKHRNIFEN